MSGLIFLSEKYQNRKINTDEHIIQIQINHMHDFPADIDCRMR
ncbi:hypothetical protein KL86DYS1_11668 [uncultured Dysgonomonas sp.]|uniref:Uncharacterized protein n=1 Tax=uncultured Dysgonomonas sp. TaxID=206096 RepID=A0A212JAP2_9BACT|nr:hypothetical protein KL86DYS1_11668 [uncultured Dysgonomonas sp.]